MTDREYLNDSASPVPATLNPMPLGPRSPATLVASPLMPLPFSTRTRTELGSTPGGAVWPGGAGGGVLPRNWSTMAWASGALGNSTDCDNPPIFTAVGVVGRVSMSTVSGESDWNLPASVRMSSTPRPLSIDTFDTPVP